MRILSVLLVLSALAAVAGCTSGPAIRVDKSPTAKLSEYKTFGFYEHSATDRPQYSSIMTARLQQATRTQLEKLGYTYDAKEPQLRVNFLLRVTDKQEIQTNPGAFYRPRLGYAGSSLDTVDYKAGTLGIDVVDVQANTLVWQGVAEGRVSRDAAQNPGPTVDGVVAEIFERFRL
jgi:hypothetical protein